MALKRSIAAALTLVFTASVAMPAAVAQSRFDAAETQEIEKIVREYLLANPEILVETIDALEAKRAEALVASQEQALEKYSDALFSAPEGTVIGNPDGNVTVVEFFDYNCGYCKQALSDMDALVESDSDVRFILKEIPVLGPQSLGASRVSLAFRQVKPDLYPEFHRKLLSARGMVDADKALAVAEEFGVEEGTLRPLMDSKEVVAELSKDSEIAEALGISGTPSYVISNQVMPGAIGLENLASAVSNVRTCGTAVC
ncbi:DsbA family protein [Jiella marina]|uniref:DsbA family protein n=1 Tax=Jiella sp. LLJ827 TaxID=2917712 RepID=UPI00210158B7|nr:DsbA family protein [Jiella sp. LLJ827]MCQ0986622.1 DsbA family protein [Jiella sp. LLJ827]